MRTNSTPDPAIHCPGWPGVPQPSGDWFPAVFTTLLLGRPSGTQTCKNYKNLYLDTILLHDLNIEFAVQASHWLLKQYVILHRSWSGRAHF